MWEDGNSDGIRSSGEHGIGDVIVKLHGRSEIETRTRASGEYVFSNVPLGGQYYIECDPPDRHAFSPKDKGDDDSVDSDVEPSTGQSNLSLLSSAADILIWDVGLYKRPPTLLEWLEEFFAGIRNPGVWTEIVTAAVVGSIAGYLAARWRSRPVASRRGGTVIPTSAPPDATSSRRLAEPEASGEAPGRSSGSEHLPADELMGTPAATDTLMSDPAVASEPTKGPAVARKVTGELGPGSSSEPERIGSEPSDIGNHTSVNSPDRDEAHQQ